MRRKWAASVLGPGETASCDEGAEGVGSDADDGSEQSEGPVAECDEAEKYIRKLPLRIAMSTGKLGLHYHHAVEACKKFSKN